jgi:hypothetical protein
MAHAMKVSLSQPSANASGAMLPPLIACWMDELLGGPIPAETNAICQDCSMCRTPERFVTPNAKTFRPDVKCCTFMPHLPNFSVGGVLGGTSKEGERGRASVEQRIAGRIGVTPLGLDAPATYHLLYANSRTEAFGVSRALRCPHYIDEGGGLCGIWRYRNSVCSTYHCKFVRGAVGRDFWNRLRQLLATVEEGVERWCLSVLDIGVDALACLFNADLGTPAEKSRLSASLLDGLVDSALYHRLWGQAWIDREREFYIAAANAVQSLTWSDVTTICGAKLQLHSRLTRDAYHKLIADALPEYLRPGEFSATMAQPGFVILRSYSPNDQVIAPQAMLDTLMLFDGIRTTTEVLEESKRRGVWLTQAYIRRLVDFAVLVPSRSE